MDMENKKKERFMLSPHSLIVLGKHAHTHTHTLIYFMHDCSVIIIQIHIHCLLWEELTCYQNPYINIML